MKPNCDNLLLLFKEPNVIFRTLERACAHRRHHGRSQVHARNFHPSTKAGAGAGATRVVANIWVASWQTSSSSLWQPWWKLKLRHLRALCVRFTPVCGILRHSRASCGLMTSPASWDMQKFLTHRSHMFWLYRKLGKSVTQMINIIKTSVLMMKN